MVIKKRQYLTNTSNHRISISLRCCLFFCFLPYHWSSWTVYVHQWDWLKGFLLLGTNYDTAWFYDLSLQRPPTLWARSEGSSVSIGDLHCTWGQIHTTTEKYKKIKIMYFTVSWPSDFSTLLTSDNMACSLNVPVSKSKKNKASIHSHCQTYRDARKE